MTAVATLSDVTPLGPMHKVELAPLDAATYRTLDRVVLPMDTSDGAGVSLRRSIGGPKIQNLDPFLLLDEFKSDDPKHYEAGFPEHPHRGFETVTIMLHGAFKHQDNKGNTGHLNSGGVQWMTAGRGIQHSETPMQADGLMWGYQLWVNLPAKEKLKEPRYQDISAEQIPAAQIGDSGIVVRVVAGKVGSVVGPVDGVTIQPNLLDVMMPAGKTFELPITEGHTLFIYTVEGLVNVLGSDTPVPASRIAIFKSEGNAIKVTTPDNSAGRFLLISGAPLKEPIARHGPFVMNTREEIIQCFHDLQSGNFS